MAVREALCGSDGWEVDLAIRRRMETVFRSATFRILSVNPAGVKTIVLVRMNYTTDGEGKPALRWGGSHSVRTQQFHFCDVKDVHFYMCDGQETPKEATDAKLRVPRVHFRAEGKRMLGFGGGWVRD
jgi:hypothetical protein